METVVAICSALGALYGLFRLGTWMIRKSPQAKQEEIAQDVANDQKKTEETGRP